MLLYSLTIRAHFLLLKKCHSLSYGISCTFNHELVEKTYYEFRNVFRWIFVVIHL